MMNLKALKRKLISWRCSMRKTGRLLIVTGVLATTALGCAWMGTQHSVRFNDYQSEREMGRLPPLPTMANGMNERRAGWDLEDPEQDVDSYSVAEKQILELDGLWDRADAAEKRGELQLDRELLRQYLERTRIARNLWLHPHDSQDRRNSATDRLDALSGLARGSNPARIQAYLNARRLFDTRKAPTEEINRALEPARSDVNLKDNVAYLKAAELYGVKEFETAARDFATLSRKYPRSEKSEAALFMAAVAEMKNSPSFDQSLDDEAQTTADDSSAASRAGTTGVDVAAGNALSGFRKLMQEYPRGKYFNDARGWMAHIMLRNGDRAGALIEYYRLLGDQRDENARLEGAFSLTLVRHRASDDEMSRVEKQLEDEPDAALAYAYHNIYNYAIDPGELYPPYDPEPARDYAGHIDYVTDAARRAEQEEKWQKDREAKGRKELTRTLSFARQLIGRHPKLPVGGAFELRAAQASLELGDHGGAVEFARRALHGPITAEQRAEALWTTGVAEHRRHHFSIARDNLLKLLKDHPSKRYAEGARRTLAMILEDAGDIDGALEQYIALDYNLDIAYFVDVLMTPEQLAGFIERNADSNKRNELMYALGLRYLRLNRWQEARAAFIKVQTTGTPYYSIFVGDSRCFDAVGKEYGCADPKEPTQIGDQPAITPALIMREMQTANELEALENEFARAAGDEKKAEALYQLASYQYGASKLLFYNPVAWSGSRYWSLSEFAGNSRFRAVNESEILWQNMQEHETPARALKVFLEVVDRFPRTPAARDALYSAAVCHERLSNYSPYWREIYHAGLHAGPRMITYQDVKAAYPDYQLPRGTYGWQPSTRTVYDGPGWAAPAKPLPRPSKTARLKILGRRLLARLQSFWNETGQRWFTAVVMLAGLWLTGRVALRHRKLLRAAISQHRSEGGKEIMIYSWHSLFWVDPVPLERREKAKQLIGAALQEGWQLARDGHSRPLLVRTIISHALLLGLLLNLLSAVGLT
jgi:TolA-binding protein